MLSLLPVLFLASGPHQFPVVDFDVSLCRDRYSAAEYEAMTRVREVPEARAQFPASYMFAPAEAGPHPGMVMLHGSEGGRWSWFSMCEARWYAAHGIATMFLCYSDCGNDSLPEAVHRVDLGRTYDALQFVRNSPYVAGQKVALNGGSRGAEQALVLSTYLARHGLVKPDAVYVHAAFGSIVGDFNWRWFADDWRWAEGIRASLPCLRDDPEGAYELDGRRLAWIPDNPDPLCSVRPALSNADCRDYTAADRPYTDQATGRRYAWRENLCGVGDDPAEDWRIGQSWTWRGDTRELEVMTEIPLHQYSGPLLIAHGMTDDLWPVDWGARWLEETLDREGVPYVERIFPKYAEVPSPLPELPDSRISFILFEDEPHVFSLAAKQVERMLALEFLQRSLSKP